MQALQGVDCKRLMVERNAPRWLRKLKKYAFIEERLTHYAEVAG